jgi:hypothetical protein
MEYERCNARRRYSDREPPPPFGEALLGLQQPMHHRQRAHQVIEARRRLASPDR